MEPSLWLHQNAHLGVVTDSLGLFVLPGVITNSPEPRDLSGVFVNVSTVKLSGVVVLSGVVKDLLGPLVLPGAIADPLGLLVLLGVLKNLLTVKLLGVVVLPGVVKDPPEPVVLLPGVVE